MTARTNTQELETAMLESRAGLRVEVLNLGASLLSLSVPTPDGRVDTVLRYPDVDDYRTDEVYLGTTVGPFANRIRDASFTLDGERYQLDANEASGHCLHSGASGLHGQLFALHKNASATAVACRTILEDGLGGFPGKRQVTVTYRLLDELALAIDFEVTTDRPTVVSLANHAYFNLGGAIDDHELMLYADTYTPVDAGTVPTGEVRPVDGGDFDLRTSRRIGAARFDHNFVIRGELDVLRPAARLASPASGVMLELSTTQPGVQLYTADGLAAPFQARAGLCLEAQGFPNAPNEPAFPSTRLDPGVTYRQRSLYRFEIGEN